MRRSMDLAWTVIVLAWLILGILYWGFTTVMFAIAATIGFWILLQSFFLGAAVSGAAARQAGGMICL